MLPKNYIFPIFILVVLIQLAIPFRMLFQQETVLDKGVYYKFKTAPVDPTDPFRGKYITLRFEANRLLYQGNHVYQRGESCYVHLENNQEGFAKIDTITPLPPIGGKDFVKAEVRSFYPMYKDSTKHRLVVRYPFNRFYMEESKAYEAELIYNEIRRDSTRIAYAYVAIDNGNAVLEEVYIDETPIREMVLQQRNQTK